MVLVCACGGATADDDINGDGGKDAIASGDSPSTSDVVTTTDGSPGADVIESSPYDGTVGKTCSSDSDCHSANGPNKAKCSSTVWSPEDYYPTSVCIIDTCAPISDTTLHFCDGPDDPSSPGICVPGFNGGVCVPKCTYDKQGGAPTGCAGKDTCFDYPTVTENGVGYCWGGCTKDGDCSDGQHCQVDQGICVVGVTPPTKNIGDACTKADNNTEACYCLYGTNNTGYCSSFCIVGQNGTCPNNFVCDPYEYRAYGYTTPSTGMAGYCTQSCAGDASSCPSSSSCTNVSVSGPDCVPP